jgi:hypothetical protein
MTLDKAELARLSRKEASNFVEQYEHLGNVGLGVWHWGLYLDGILASVVSFGVPCFAPRRGFLAETSRMSNARVLQLCRGATAFWAPRNTPSRTIGLALKQISMEFGPCLVVAYADLGFSEVGTIYQSSNGIYTGVTNPKGQANYRIHGRIVSGWVVRKRFGTRCRLRLRKIDPDVAVLPLQPKLRYILLAGPPRFRSHARKILEPYRQPYPKRIDLGIAPMNIAQLVDMQSSLRRIHPLTQ